MKLIRLMNYGDNFSTKVVLRSVMNQSPGRALSLDEMRRRIKIMDALDEAADHILVKNEDFVLICEAIKIYPWAVANKNLLQLIDDILESGDASGANGHADSRSGAVVD